MKEQEKQSTGEKTTLVDDLDAEIEADDDSKKEENAQEGELGSNSRSRNAQKTSPEEKKSEEVDAKSEELSCLAEDAAVAEPVYDYTAIDEFMAFFDQETLESISCGYFNKIFQALLTKAKTKVLPYLLLHRKGDIFNLLIKNLQHHSLSQLMVELMQLKITGQAAGAGGRNRASSDFDSKTDDENITKGKDKEESLSAKDKQMVDVLNQKRQEVVVALIDNLNSRSSDFEACLNAHLILTELTEMETTFGKLLERDNFARLLSVACDSQNEFQGYALSVLSSIINEYPDFEKSLPAELSKDFQQTMHQSFNDLTYSCLLTIRASDESLGLPPQVATRNQSGDNFRRFGMRRMRALELIR